MSLDKPHYRLRVWIRVLLGFSFLTMAGCAGPTEPDDVYCLTSESEDFFGFIRLESRRASAESGFSYHDTGEKVWSELNGLSGKQAAYDPSNFIDLLVKDGDSYVVMLNNISQKKGRAKISIFEHGDGDKKIFAKRLKRGLLDGDGGQVRVLEEKCSG
jgi:hypothetical protein